MPISIESNMSENLKRVVANLNSKTKFSRYTVENIVYSNVINAPRGANNIETRRNALSWILEVMKDSQEAMRVINGAKKEGNPFAEEEAKKDILHKIGWRYMGRFCGPEYSVDEYPELFFSIKMSSIGDTKWYMATYGIPSSNPNDLSVNVSSYSYFSTLEESLKFIVDEYKMIGIPQLKKRISKNKVMQAKSENGILNTRDEIAKFINNNKNEIASEVNRISPEGSVNHTIEVIRRCTDISTIYDLADELLVPLAKRELNEAREFEETRARAEEMKKAAEQKRRKATEDSHEEHKNEPKTRINPRANIMGIKGNGRALSEGKPKVIDPDEKIDSEEPINSVTDLLSDENREVIDPDANLNDSKDVPEDDSKLSEAEEMNAEDSVDHVDENGSRESGEDSSENEDVEETEETENENNNENSPVEDEGLAEDSLNKEDEYPSEKEDGSEEDAESDDSADNTKPDPKNRVIDLASEIDSIIDSETI